MPPLSLQLVRRVLFAGAAAAASASAGAATLPTGFTESQIVTGLSNPTAMAFAPDGRLFVCLQGGQLRVVKNNALLPTPFLADDTGSRAVRRGRALVDGPVDVNPGTRRIQVKMRRVHAYRRHSRSR